LDLAEVEAECNTLSGMSRARHLMSSHKPVDTITVSSGDADLMKAFEAKRQQGGGGEIGELGETPHDAAENTGWKVIRSIHSDTDRVCTAVLAQDQRGDLWVVNDPGPWAVRVTFT
jgi:hypothetical protein